MRKIIFMLNKLWTDLKAKGDYPPLSDDFNSENLGHYYILFGTDLSRLNKLISRFDAEGIPLNDAYIDVEDARPHYYPISIGQVGLSIYHEYLSSGSLEKRNHFLKIADWFIKNQIQDDRLGAYWLTEIPKPEYKVFNPWKSAFTQSRALSILTRAWQETGEKIYFDTATKALFPFQYDISEGGVAIRRPGYETFYEEYVAEYPTRVLDGHLFSLFGLYDYIRVTSGPDHEKETLVAKRLFDDGIEGLLQALPKFDLGYWLLFNRCEIPDYPKFDPCTINYLQLITRQLEVISKITNRTEFDDYRIRFMNYLSWKNILRMYRSKYQALKNLNRI